MPGGDRTGPAGLGAMTGRAAGYCAGYNAPGFVNPLPRMGMGRGRGMGRGFGRGFAWRRMAFDQSMPFDRVVPVYPAQPTKEQEQQYLENETKALESEQEALKQELEAVKKRLEELKQK
jgi:hypothetical protein